MPDSSAVAQARALYDSVVKLNYEASQVNAGQAAEDAAFAKIIELVRAEERLAMVVLVRSGDHSEAVRVVWALSADARLTHHEGVCAAELAGVASTLLRVESRASRPADEIEEQALDHAAYVFKARQEGGCSLRDALGGSLRAYIKAAVTRPADEQAVAWLVRLDNGQRLFFPNRRAAQEYVGLRGERDIAPLYAAPPAERTVLTEAERAIVVNFLDAARECGDKHEFYADAMLDRPLSPVVAKMLSALTARAERTVGEELAERIAFVRGLTMIHEDSTIRPASMSYVKPSEYRQHVNRLLDFLTTPAAPEANDNG